MADRDRKGRGAFFGIVWIVLAALALGYLRIMGYQPRTLLAWLLLVTLGPAIMILPYALAENVMGRVGIHSAERWSETRPRRILDVRRVLLTVIALVLTLMALLAMTWLATGPLATLLRPLGPIARHHFGAVR